MRVLGVWPNYRLFAYERRLAAAELEALGASVLDVSPLGIKFEHPDPKSLLGRITYVAELSFESSQWVGEQRAAEVRHLEHRSRPSRQATRFGVHGFHEYKGKFNPQLARSLMNLADPEAEVLADPFAGSGTALIEALRLGRSVSGRDRSPIAVFMARAKVDALTCRNPANLIAELTDLSDVVGSELKRGQDADSEVRVGRWSRETHEYLRHWMTAPAMAGLTRGVQAHDGMTSLASRISLLCLSAILRSTSLQEPQDLRVRRRPAGFVAPSLREAYTEQIDRVVCGLSELEAWSADLSTDVELGSATDEDLFRATSVKARRSIVTSPPYATALPYIDTDRLSILMLGLGEVADLRKLEAELLGSREWNTATKAAWWRAYTDNSRGLPVAVIDLLSVLVASNEQLGAGFRRAAVPALLYRYFGGMTDAFASWQRQLRSGERAVVVVGRNRTGPRGRQITIDTPSLLARCAETVGFELVDQIALETWPRYGMHAANGVEAEDALVLERV